MRNGRRGQGGFTYLLLLVLLAIMAITCAASLEVGTTLSRRDAERELLRIGAEYEKALINYRLASPLGQAGRSPMTFDDLLLDRRQASVKRHLRKLYFDPLTGSNRWGVLRGSDGSIAAIYSLAEGRPIKKDGFDESWLRFNGATAYSRWCFGVELGVDLAREVQSACFGATPKPRATGM